MTVRAMILGAAGQVGRALSATPPSGVTAIAADRSVCDVTDRDSLSRCIEQAQPDLIINAAAYTAVDRAEDEPAAANLLNATVPGWVAAIAQEVQARVVHLSTDFVFDGALSRPLMPDDEVGPLSIYGASKAEGERNVLAIDPAAMIVRTSWVYSASRANFVNTILRLIAERETINVVADQVGTPTYASSLAGAIWDLALQKRFGIYHYSDAGVASWYDFAVAIQEEAVAMGAVQREARIVPVSTADYPTAARRPCYSVLDKTTTWQALGRISPHWRSNFRLMLQEKRTNG